MTGNNISLLVSEPRPQFRELWTRLSKGLPLRLAETGIRELLATEVDSVVMPGWATHEQLGGSPLPGQALVISNERGVVGKPRWVVTTPPFASNAEDARGLGIPEWPKEPKRQGYETFSRILAAVVCHNERSFPKISTVAFEPEFLSFSKAYAEEAEGVIEALRAVSESVTVG